MAFNWGYRDDIYVDEDLLYGNPKEKKPVQSVPAPAYGARKTDPITSHEATLSSSTAANVQQAIIAAAKKYGAGTEEEFSEWTGIPRPSISPQFRPMIRAGLLVDVIDPATGKKLKRKNQSGKSALVRGLPTATAVPQVSEITDFEMDKWGY